MIKKTTPAKYNWADELLKSFVNSNGFIELPEYYDPEFIHFVCMNKTIENDFLIILADDTCPICGSKLNKNGIVEFNLNNTIKVYKNKYICSNSECRHTARALWNDYISPNCNYSDKIKKYCSKINKISRLSYQKEAERLELEKRVKLRRETFYRFHDKNSKEYLDNEEKKQKEELKKKNVQFSNILSYDEQYIPIQGKMTYRLTGMDPITKWVYKNEVITEEEFNSKAIKNFIKSIIDEYKIDIIITDGSNKYPPIIEELGLKHKLCNFHHMKNFIDENKKELNHLKKENNRIKQKIFKNEAKIKELKEKRKGTKGRIKSNDKKSRKLVNKIKTLKRKNSNLRTKKRENKINLDQYEKCIHDLSLMLKSKNKKTGFKRYIKIKDNLDKIPKKTHNFIQKTSKKLEKLLLHTKNILIPTTNNIMELYYLTTLNRKKKKEFKTIKGVKREIGYQTLRWNERLVLKKIRKSVK